MSISDLMNLLKSYGIFVDVNSEYYPVILFALLMLGFGLFSLLCIFNIVIYLFVIFNIDNVHIINFVSKNVYFLKI